MPALTIVTGSPGTGNTTHAAFADLGAYAHHRVETADRTPADVAAEITRRIAAGDTLLRSD